MTNQYQIRKISNNKNLKYSGYLFICLFICLFIYLFTCLFVYYKPASAQESISLAIYPPLLEVMMKPGKSITQVYKIYNQSQTDQILVAKVVPFEPADEYGNVRLIEGDTQNVIRETQDVIRDTQDVIRDTQDVIRDTQNVSRITYPVSPSDWFSLQNADIILNHNFLLKANSQKDVVLKIKIPENSPESDYYYTLIFETVPGQKISGQSQIQSKIGGNIILTVSESGTPQTSLTIDRFEIKPQAFTLGNLQFIDSFDQAEFKLTLQNNGQTVAKPIGRITTEGTFGQKYLNDLVPENILVNSKRQINCSKTIENSDKNDKNILITPTNCQIKSKILLGKYQVKTEIGINKVSDDLAAEFVFFAFPFKLSLGILALLILLISFSNFKTKKP